VLTRRLVGLADVLIEVPDALKGFRLSGRLKKGDVVCGDDGGWVVWIDPRGLGFRALVELVRRWMRQESITATTVSWKREDPSPEGGGRIRASDPHDLFLARVARTHAAAQYSWMGRRGGRGATGAVPCSAGRVASVSGRGRRAGLARGVQGELRLAHSGVGGLADVPAGFAANTASSRLASPWRSRRCSPVHPPTAKESR
jgi:hypothetical protein